MKTIIIYGSTTGVTEGVANLIYNRLENADLFSVHNLNFSSLVDYDLIIMGTSTWGIGDLQDDWEENLLKLEEVDFSNKKVALFGTGDQDGYPDSFISAVDQIYKIIVSNGGTVIGETQTEGYNFDDSAAVKDGKFICLAIDEDTQPDLTEKRVEDWVSQIKKESV